MKKRVQFEAEQVEKVWGGELILHNAEYCGKILQVKLGCASSMHRHLEKAETLMVIVGLIRMEIDGPGGTRLEFDMGPFEYVEVEPGQWHRFRGLSPVCYIAEFSTRHRDEDVERREPGWGGA